MNDPAATRRPSGDQEHLSKICQHVCITEKNAITGVEVLVQLVVVLVSLEDLDTTFLRCKWAHIPNSDSVVHGIGQHIRTIRGQTQASHCVIVASHAIQ
ncbi:hypothetical protein E2C01_006510 [Portunus trituberculatus]|uniref:Uncharacterized protein n=1 Tax=Portunus trituberculatus TaxID=210409 RepID=A0A5B7CZQ9_PORTR|nr:hypothetical protein [Portunus trituberculatus]